MYSAPVITLDGPGGVGKGTMSCMLANELGWNYLDSGALYRLVAACCLKHEVALDDEEHVALMAKHMDVSFEISDEGLSPIILLEKDEVTKDIRTEQMGNMASKIAALPQVRAALLERQHSFRKHPGLVTDGRDMGTVIFPDADLKFFLTATAEERGKRRHKQLKEKGMDVNLTHLVAEIAERDERDQNRAVSPLKPADDSIVIDTTAMSVAEVYAEIKSYVRSKLELESR